MQCGHCTKEEELSFSLHFFQKSTLFQTKMATLAAMATALEELVQHLEGMKTQLGEKNEEIKALKEENSGLKKRLSKQSGMLQVRAASL